MYIKILQSTLEYIFAHNITLKYIKVHESKISYMLLNYISVFHGSIVSFQRKTGNFVKIKRINNMYLSFINGPIFLVIKACKDMMQ